MVKRWSMAILLCAWMTMASWVVGETIGISGNLGGENREDALLFDKVNYGQRYSFSEDPRDYNVNRWYKIVAQEDDEYSITIWHTKGSAMFLEARFYDYRGEPYKGNMPNGNLLLVKREGMETVDLSLNQGEIVYVKIEDGVIGCAYFDIAVCNGKKHKVMDYSEVLREPTCVEQGERGYMCEFCGRFSAVEVLPATGHIYGELVTETEATCISKGIEKVYCIKCNEVLLTNELPLGNHNVGKMKVIMNATCITEGRGEQRCTNCNILLDEETYAATGHVAGKWIETKEATCTSRGIRSQLCVECGAVLSSEEIPEFGHKESDWILQSEASCIRQGIREKRCEDCKVVLETEILNAFGHSYTEWEIITEATKRQEGERMRHCIRCGNTQSEKIEKLPKFLGIF